MVNRSAILTAVLAVVPVAGCQRPPAAGGGNPAPAGPTVTVVKPEMRPVKRVVEQPGTVQAFEETALHAKFPGYVGAVADDPDKKDRPPHDRQIDIGSRVKKDQVLAVLAVPELDKEWEQKKALVKQAEAEVRQAEKAHAAAGAAVDASKALGKEAQAGVARAGAEFDRWKTELTQADELVARKVIDPQSRDVVRKQFQAAEAAKAEAEARVGSAAAAVRKSEADRNKAAADIDTAKARQDVAAAEVGRLEALREYTRIKTPFDGVVTRRSVNTGDLVSSGERMALFSVARIDPVRVVVSVPEADAGLVNPGQAVTIALQAVQAAPLSGTVTRTSWALEHGSRTLRTEIDLPNEKGQVRPGTYVLAKLTAELPAAWAVPAAAVGKVGDEAVIYLAENGKAVRVAVQLLRGDGQFTQVRRYKKPGAADWTDVTGAEAVATPASALSDAQTLP